MPLPAHKARITALAILAYLALAYGLVPILWKRHERHVDFGGRPLITHTSAGIPGDPLNVGLIGSRDDVLRAMAAAGWIPADPVTTRSSIKIGVSVVLHHPYPGAPVSALFFDGRLQDLAFEREIGRSAGRRHHVRFWRVVEHGYNGRDVWLGSASFDRGVGISHDTGQVTHHIDGDLDKEREFLVDTLEQAGQVTTRFSEEGIGPTEAGRNGGGDKYFTDGNIALCELKSTTAAPN